MSRKDHEKLPEHTTWLTVDAHLGYPCRVSLLDAPLGSRVLALSHRHHDEDSSSRRANNTAGMMIHADAVHGSVPGETSRGLFAKPEVDKSRPQRQAGLLRLRRHSSVSTQRRRNIN